jgi:predicted RecA/RadA family phage recombinase
MATNFVRDLHEWPAMPLAATSPTAPVSNDPVRFGSLTGVALTDEGEGGNAATEATVHLGMAVWDLSVKAVNDSGNSAVAAGDPIFYVDADTPKLSKKATGYFFGFALEAISSGGTDTINVLHVPSPGSGTLGTGSVSATNLASGAVTAVKLSATLKKGYVPLPLASAREIASNDIVNTAGDAGMLSSNTTPILQRVNAATDKKLRLNWAASNNDEIVWDFTYPPDLDDTAPVVIHLIAGMAGATNTPVLAVSYFEGVGDTNAGGNTAALSATVADVTVTIAAADVAAAGFGASIGVVPGAHTTDALYLYGAYVEYQRA